MHTFIVVMAGWGLFGTACTGGMFLFYTLRASRTPAQERRRW